MTSLRAVLAAFVLASLAPGAARAEGGPLGVGLIVGSPTGLSLKYYLGASGQAIDAAVGAAFAGADGIQVHADYLWHPVLLLQEQAFNLPLHLGVGARLLSHDGGRDDDDDLHLGVRAPVGMTFDFNEIPLDVFIEVALVLDFRDSDRHDDSVGFDLNAGVGVRYYF